MDTTFVTCVEAGTLEKQVALLVRSIRRFGGDYKDCPIIAVQPRFGPSIGKDTQRAFAECNVNFVRKALTGKFHWDGMINKAASMAWAEQQVTTTNITWVDGDIVFVRPPVGIIPDQEFGFASCPGQSDMGTNGEDQNADYWAKVSDILGVSYREADFVETFVDEKRIYEYYHGGLYTYPVREKFSADHFAFMKAMLSAPVTSKSCGAYYHDMVTLSMAARKVRGPRVVHDEALNFDYGIMSGGARDVALLGRCSVLHYHGVFYKDAYSKHAPIFRENLPDDAMAFIDEHAPLTVDDMPLSSRLMRKVLNEMRGRKRAAVTKEQVAY